MTRRYLVLVVAATAVLGMGLYLFVQVRAAPDPLPRELAATPTAETQMESRPAAVIGHASDPPAPGPARGGQELREHPQLVGSAPRAPSLAPADEARANPRLDAIMEQANKAYDRQDFDEARAIAAKLLVKDPGNIRMMRIMVSASCIDGDTPLAQSYYEKLPKLDREQMRARCDRYGVTFKEPSQ